MKSLSFVPLRESISPSHLKDNPLGIEFWVGEFVLGALKICPSTHLSHTRVMGLSSSSLLYRFGGFSILFFQDFFLCAL